MTLRRKTINECYYCFQLKKEISEYYKKIQQINDLILNHIENGHEDLN